MTDLYQAALDSCRWSSMNPEATARVLVTDYERHLASVEADFRAAGPDEAKAEAEFAAYSEGYEKRYRAWLAARGRTASVMVTGASGFPTRRNRKALDTEHRRSVELNEWAEKARRQAIKRLKPPKDPAAERAKLEQLLETMKAANRIVRRKWTDERKLAALMADLGLKEETAKKVLEPDFCGRVGFPSHTLASVRGKIKRLGAA